jgi:hypothetical protein
MAGKPDQQPLGHSLQRRQRADCQSCCHPAKVTGGCGSRDDTFEHPNPESMLNSILDPVKRLATRQKSGVDSK